MVNGCMDLDYVVEDVQVLLHTVVQPQVGDEVAGEHAVQPVEEAVHTGVQVHQVCLVDRTWRGWGFTMSIICQPLLSEIWLPLCIAY